MSTGYAYKVRCIRPFLKGATLRYHPEPQEDELLSSWLVRAAYAHLSDPATFINLYFPDYRDNFWNRDVDTWAPGEFVRELAGKSGLSEQAIKGMALSSYEGYLAETIYCNTRNVFVQPLGNCCRIKVKHGLRFCPLCLQNDEIPYFRKKWRLSFSTACLKHNCFLMDRCQECGLTVIPYRSSLHPESDIVHCYKCGADLRSTLPERVQEGSYGLWAIKKLYEVLDTGLYRFTGGYTYSFLFFQILRHFAKIVYFWGKGKGFLDHEVMGQVIGFRKRKLKNNLLENIPLKEQYLLFSGLVRLFEGFPGRPLSFCAGGRMRATDLTRDIGYIPFWYKWLVDAFDKGLYSVSLEEVKFTIEYLKKTTQIVNKASVGKIMGICPDFKKRKDIVSLFANSN